MAKLNPFQIAALLGKPPAAAGRAMEKKRPRWRSACVVCHAAFVGVTHKRYCGVACRMRAMRARKRAKRSESPPEARSGLG